MRHCGILYVAIHHISTPSPLKLSEISFFWACTIFHPGFYKEMVSLVIRCSNTFIINQCQTFLFYWLTLVGEAWAKSKLGSMFGSMTMHDHVRYKSIKPKSLVSLAVQLNFKACRTLWETRPACSVTVPSSYLGSPRKFEGEFVIQLWQPFAEGKGLGRQNWCAYPPSCTIFAWQAERDWTPSKGCKEGRLNFL